MVVFLRSALYRITGKPFETLEGALQTLFSDSLLKRAQKSSSPLEMLDFLAREKRIERAKLLELAAQRMGLSSETSLQAPDITLISRTGFDADILRQRAILPQTSSLAPAGYSLVVAHPGTVNRQEFETAGVRILLGSAEDIAGAWAAWDQARAVQTTALNLSEDVEKVLKQVVMDCADLGAQEVFLGHPNDCSYEGIVNGKRFSGFVHQKVFLETLATLKRLGYFTLASNPPSRAALTRNFERPIVCLTWSTGSNKATATASRSMPAYKEEQPVAEEIAVAEAPQEIEPAPAPLAQSPSILLVEDDERFALVVSQILSARGYSIQRAVNGEQALSLFEEKSISPQLIISDVHMPVVDGRLLLERLRKLQINTPAIMLTSDEDQLLEADLILLGANAYVRKSEDPRVLLAWVQNLLLLSSREGSQ